MEHCAANRTTSLSDASERLIEKLILDPGLVGSQRSRELAFLINKFKDECGDFTNKQGKFNKANIWIMASDENIQGYGWHHRAVTKSYNDNLDERDDENNGKCAYYVFSVETYLCIAEYYKDHPNEGSVKIFMPDDDCDSEDPSNEWEYVGTGKAGAKAAAAEAEKATAEAAARGAARKYGR